MGSIPIFDIIFALLFAHSLVLVLDSLREKTLASLDGSFSPAAAIRPRGVVSW